MYSDAAVAIRLLLNASIVSRLRGALYDLAVDDAQFQLFSKHLQRMRALGLRLRGSVQVLSKFA